VVALAELGQLRETIVKKARRSMLRVQAAFSGWG